MRSLCLICCCVCLGSHATRSLLAQEAAPTANKHYQKHSFESKDGTVLAYWIMSPKRLDPEKRYPLVLALHGRGGKTTAATELGADALREQYPCFVLAPSSTKQGNWLSPEGRGKKNVKAMLPVVLEAIDAVLKQHPIDENRIYVTGQSMGAVGTFGAIVSRPSFFAAAIPVAGGWAPKDADKMKDIPMWVFHGDQDKTVPTKYSRDMVEAIRNAGGVPKYTEYKNVGHNSWSRAYADPKTWSWLFDQSVHP